MRIFLFEFITGGGCYLPGWPDPPSGSMLAEGAAMIRTVAADFVAAGARVYSLLDARLPKIELPGCTVRRVRSAEHLQSAMRNFVGSFDRILLIAPEFDPHPAQWLEQFGPDVLLCPNAEAFRLAADKLRVSRELAALNVPTCAAWAWDDASSTEFISEFPLVIKPRFGAGSHQVQLVHNAAELRSLPRAECEMIATKFCPGLAVSVAVLCGSKKTAWPLPACRQLLSDDGRFTYLGGELPLPDPLDLRARSLATMAVGRLLTPLCVGYIGVDMVLGEAENGSADYVIEINPRLTTSYVGLRRYVRTNLADAMLNAGRYRTVSISCTQQRVRFTAAGEVSVEPL